MADSTRTLAHENGSRTLQIILIAVSVSVGMLSSYWGLWMATDNYVNYTQPSVGQVMVTVSFIVISFICYWNAGKMLESLKNQPATSGKEEKELHDATQNER